jgi:hypothetical protein
MHLLLLGIRKARHRTAGDQIGAIGQRHVDQAGGAMADGRDQLAGLPELAHQRPRGGVAGQVEHGAVAAGEEDGRELPGAPRQAADRGRRLPQRGLRLVELLRLGVVGGELDGPGVQRRGAAGRRGDDDLEVLLEDGVGVGEFGLERVGGVSRDSTLSLVGWGGECSELAAGKDVEWRGGGGRHDVGML